VCRCEESAFAARASVAGSARILRVDGRCTCPRSGYELRLDVDDPDVARPRSEVVLRLVVKAPEVGAEMITATAVAFEGRIGDAAERVIVRLPGDQETFILAIVDEASSL
jgi:hypothetical protein